MSYWNEVKNALESLKKWKTGKGVKYAKEYNNKLRLIRSLYNVDFDRICEDVDKEWSKQAKENGIKTNMPYWGI